MKLQGTPEEMEQAKNWWKEQKKIFGMKLKMLIGCSNKFNTYGSSF